jgi:hypothetical protein
MHRSELNIRPTLLNSCAKAATAAEAGFRINGLDPSPRATRIVALDEGAAAVVKRTAQRHWQGAHFLTYGPVARVVHDDGGPPDVILRAADGSQARLSEELVGADMTVMVATVDDGAEAASVIGEACMRRGIMTTGLVLGEGRAAAAAVSALRLYARVLVVSGDEGDVPEVLAALRA